MVDEPPSNDPAPKRLVDEHSNFEELRTAIHLAFFPDRPGDAVKNLGQAVALIENPEYGFLLDRVEDKGSILMEMIYKKLHAGGLTNKNWHETADPLDTILATVAETWSKDFLHRVVNHIGNSAGYVNILDAGYVPAWQGKQRTTIRDMIENDDTYKDVLACKTCFDDIFHKYKMQKREEFRDRVSSGNDITRF